MNEEKDETITKKRKNTKNEVGQRKRIIHMHTVNNNKKKLPPKFEHKGPTWHRAKKTILFNHDASVKF